MKPSKEELALRNEKCMSIRLFNSIIRNFIVCTILSAFMYSVVFDEFSILNAFVFFVGFFIFYHVALFFGELPFQVFSETENNSKAPSFYADRTLFGRILVFVIIFLVFFLLFCIIRYEIANHPSM